MRILVCFKALPDLEQVLPADWDCFSPELDFSYAKRSPGCFDEAALEMALHLRDSLIARGEAVHCAAVTVGKEPPPFLRKNLFAAGFDAIFAIDMPHSAFQPLHVARCLAQHCREEGGYDLIFTGKQAGFADTGCVPFYLAQLLGLYAVADVLTLDAIQEKATIQRQTQQGRQELCVALPLLAVVGNSPHTALRAATLRQQLQAGGKALSRKQMPPPPLRVLEFERENSERSCVFWQPEESSALATRLWETLTRSLSADMQIIDVQTQYAPQSPILSKYSVALAIAPDALPGDALPGLAAAACAFGAKEVSLWLPGICARAAAALPLPGEVGEVICAYRDTLPAKPNPDAALDWLECLYRERRPDALLLWGSTTGHEWGARLSLRTQTPFLPHTQTLCLEPNGFLVVRKPVCSSRLLWRQQISFPCICGIAPTSVPSVARTDSAHSGQISVPDFPDWEQAGVSPVLWQNSPQPDGDIPLRDVSVLLIGGAGLGREGCELLRRLVRRLCAEGVDAAAAYSRAAATNGWGPTEQIIGQSGKIAAPALCVAFAVSGASAFLAGIKQAETLIAANLDPDAPIFRHADFGIKTDAVALLRQLVSRTSA